MSDLDLKNQCMEDAEIDLTRYSNSELTQIREAMRMYAERKLKLFAILSELKKLRLGNCCKQCKKPIEKGFRFCGGECKQYYYR